MNRRFRLWVALLLVVASAGRSPLLAQQLTRKTFSDGSGSIGVAPEWHIQSAANGAVTAAGPHGASIGLGLTVPCVPHNVADYYPGIPPGALFPGMPRLDFTDPARALVDLTQHNARASSVKFTNLRFKAIEPTDVPNGKAAFNARRIQDDTRSASSGSISGSTVRRCSSCTVTRRSRNGSMPASARPARLTRNDDTIATSSRPRARAEYRSGTTLRGYQTRGSSGNELGGTDPAQHGPRRDHCARAVERQGALLRQSVL